MQHPEEGLIHAWIDGALPPVEAAELEAHVAGCSECAATVAEARGLVAASSRIVSHLDAVPGGVVPVVKPRQHFLLRAARPSAIAATLILAVSIYGREKTAEFVQPGAGAREIGPLALPDSMLLAQSERAATTRPSVPPPPSRVTAAQPGTASESRERGTVGAGESAPIPELQKAAAASVAAPTSTAPVAASVGGSASASAADAGVAQRSRALAEVVDGRRAAAGAAVNDQRSQRAMPPSAGMARSEMAEPSINPAVAEFVGCYEMGVSTDILPSRFALVADSSSALAGQFVIRYLDAQNNPTDRIVDAGWRVEGNRAVIRSPGRGTILTLTKTGLSVTGSSPNGLRSGRVTFCR